jgi:hypothetical protein
VGAAFYQGGYTQGGVFHPGYRSALGYGVTGYYGAGFYGAPDADASAGYDGGGYGPTGYGVVYNVPPNPPLWVHREPRIIYLSARRFQQRHAASHRRAITMVRGTEVSKVYY